MFLNIRLFSHFVFIPNDELLFVCCLFHCRVWSVSMSGCGFCVCLQWSNVANSRRNRHESTKIKSKCRQTQFAIVCRSDDITLTKQNTKNSVTYFLQLHFLCVGSVWECIFLSSFSTINDEITTKTKHDIIFCSLLAC